MARVGRPPSCECGTCRKCKVRVRTRERYQALSPEERRAVVARRDREKTRAADRARYRRDPARREVAMKWQRENPEKAKAAAKVYRAQNREAANAHIRAWRERNPEKVKAQNAVHYAVRSGKLVRQSCEVCGSDLTEAHHTDYSRPLDVRWLCKRHHEDAHHINEAEAA